MVLKEFKFQADPQYPEVLNNFLDSMTIDGSSKETIKSYSSHITQFLKYIKVIKNTYPKKIKADEFIKLQRKEALNILKDISIENFSEKELKNINYDNIKGFLKWCKEVLGNDNSSSGAKLSAIKTFYKYLTNEDINILDKDVTENIKKPKQQRKLPSYLTQEEAILFLNTIKNSNSKYKTRDYVIFLLYLTLGLRLTELEGIDIKDINFNNKKVTILRKRNKISELDLTNSCINSIGEYMNTERMELLKKCKKDETALFLSEMGNRIATRTIEKLVKQYAELAGLDTEKIHTHTLRHTALTMLYNSTKSILVVKEIADHSDIKTTQIYTHIDSEQKKSAINSSPFANI